MSSVIVSHVPTSVTSASLLEFFAFCGSIKAVNDLGTEDGYNKFQVTFSLNKALSTALLLNDAELDGVPIKVEEDKFSEEAAEKEADKLPATNDIPKDAIIETTKTNDPNYDDIVQEEKPKLAIVAQLLASGYKISDDLVARAISVDREKGISTKFRLFLTDLDNKYIHSTDPESTALKNISKAQNQLTSIQNSWEGLKYQQKLNHYFDWALQSSVGVKVHEFYKQAVTEVKQVHAEATRLYNLKKAESKTPVSEKE